jgi:hypothetical protein
LLKGHSQNLASLLSLLSLASLPLFAPMLLLGSLTLAAAAVYSAVADVPYAIGFTAFTGVFQSKMTFLAPLLLLSSSLPHYSCCL